MSALSKFKLKAQAYDMDAFWAPGHWFFCRRIEIPADLESGEEEGFALLELESLSPFPLDHLHYGYVLDGAGRYAFVFAAYKRRFERVDSSNWRRVDAVLPDFFMGLNQDAGRVGSLMLVSEQSMVAFEYDNLSTLPCRFYAEARKPVEEEDNVGSLRRQFDEFSVSAKEKLGLSRLPTWYLEENAKWEGRNAWLGAVDAADSSFFRLGFSRNQIWKADLRDPELLELAKKDERQNGVLWKSSGVLAACVALLTLGEIYWAGSTGYLAYRESGIEKRSPNVEEIENLRQTSVTLRDFQESNLAPFAMIEALRPYQNYPDIIYRKFETDGPDTLILEGRASRQSLVTEFKKRLEGFAKIDSVDITRSDNNTSGSTFTMSIRFRFGAFYELAEVSSNG